MSLKDFFKPTKWKILLFLVVSLIGFILYSLSSFCGMADCKPIECDVYKRMPFSCCGNCGGYSFGDYAQILFFYLISPANLHSRDLIVYAHFDKDLGLLDKPLLFLINLYDKGFGLIFDIIYWYFISCLIVYGYEKFKNKKK